MKKVKAISPTGWEVTIIGDLSIQRYSAESRIVDVRDKNRIDPDGRRDGGIVATLPTSWIILLDP